MAFLIVNGKRIEYDRNNPLSESIVKALPIEWQKLYIDYIEGEKDAWFMNPKYAYLRSGDMYKGLKTEIRRSTPQTYYTSAEDKAKKDAQRSELTGAARESMNQAGNVIGNIGQQIAYFTPLWFAPTAAHMIVDANNGDLKLFWKDFGFGLAAPYAIGKGLLYGVKGYLYLKNTNLLNAAKNQYIGLKTARIINDSAKRPNLFHSSKNYPLAGDLNYNRSIPIEDGVMYHSTNGFVPHSLKPYSYLKNGKIYLYGEVTPGQLKLNGESYTSARAPKTDTDYIWWDTNGHNTGKLVFLRRPQESINVLDNMPNLNISSYSGRYEPSYFVTTPETTNLNNTVKLTFDPFSNSYIPSVKRKTVTNRMSSNELLKVLETPTVSTRRYEPRYSLELFQRSSKLTDAEKLGIPKHERSSLGNFKTQIDWNPREWMKNNVHSYDSKPYTAIDAMALQSHVPEYLKIEKQLVDAGKYNPGILDPRSYIQLLSKAAQYLDPNPIYSGVKTPELSADYNGIFWGTRSYNGIGNGKLAPYQARAYAGDDRHLLQLSVPKDAITYNYNGEGKVWHSLKDGLTNDIVEQKFLLGYDRVNINNVIDAGKNSGNLYGKTKYNPFLTKLDEAQIASRLPLNDVIINLYVPRKSIIGNNGNFNIDDLNIYRKSGGKLNYLNLFK